jgi:hypothetical protein
MYENVLESVRLNTAEDDLLLETTKHSSEIIENKNILRRINHIYFLVCNSCLWCATYFGVNDLESLSASPTHALSCHLCNSCNTELMPISADVSSRMAYDITSGMETEYYRTNDVVDRQQSTNEVHQVSVYL